MDYQENCHQVRRVQEDHTNFYILEHKRMSDVCDHYLTRAKLTAENQYVSLRNVISEVIQRQGWKVEQIIFITDTRYDQ